MKSIFFVILVIFITPYIYSQEISFDQLNLKGSALYAATKIKERFPNVIFTGGTRTLDSQSREIARNIYRSQDSGWVGATYRDSAFTRRLNQEIINNWNIIKGSESLILQTVNIVFNNDNDGARAMSKHLIGYAFDLRVNCVNYNELNNFVMTLPGYHRFLTREGSLAIWHLEFNETPIPVNNDPRIFPLEGTWIGDRNSYNRMYVFRGSEVSCMMRTGSDSGARGTFSINAAKTRLTINYTHHFENGRWISYTTTHTADLTISGNRFTIRDESDAGEHIVTYIKL